jgi:hypothetical protein
MNRLKEILTELKDKTAESLVDPGSAPFATRHGTEALVRNAKQALPQLETLYKEEVMANVFIVGVNGPNQEAFAKIAQEKFGTTTIDYNLVLKKLGERITARHAAKTYSPQDGFLLIDELLKIKKEYNMSQIPMPRNNGYQDGAFNGTMEEGIAKVIGINYGNALQSAVTRREIGNAALADKFSDKYYPVVLLNYDEKSGIDTRFLPRPMAFVETTAEPVTEKEVKSVLTGISNSLRGKSSKTKPSTAQEQENE